VALAKQKINAGDFEVARIYAKKAIFIKHNRPEAYNILGGICEAKGDKSVRAYRFFSFLVSLS